MEETGSEEPVLKALKQNFLFEALDRQEIKALADEIWLEQIPAGSVIVREGDEADALYMVVLGGVNVHKRNGQFLSYLGPGGFFGEMALFTNTAKRTADCRTALDTTCAVVRKEVLYHYCDANPGAGLKIYRAIIRTLVARLTITTADLATLMSAQIQSQEQVDFVVARAKAKKNQP